MTVHVLLPTEADRIRIGELPGTVSAQVWDGTGDPPAGVGDTVFWVAPFSAPADLDAVFAAMPRLAVVQLQTAGADVYAGRVPDGVLLCDARGVHGSSTSEWVMAGLLGLLRYLPQFTLAAERRQWAYTSTDELAGKRVLVVGAGDIGEQLRRRLLPFDVTVTMVARRPRDGVFAVADLPGLLPAADVVVLLVPLTPATRGMVDADFLALMPDGSVLVNAARGPVVDTAALTAELLAGRLRAVLDVTDPEPLPAGHPLWDAPGLLITPHVAGSVPGFPARSMALARRQLDRYLAGQPLDNVVDGGY